MLQYTMKCFFSLFLFFLLATPVLAQHPDTLATPVARPTGSLWLDVDGLAFFKDNEYDGHIAKGYTLPGLRLRPVVAYQLNRRVSVELGAHALLLNGANKYPNYVFHDVPQWKGHQYQAGAHLLPAFRVDAKVGQLQFTFGELHGGTCHDISLPLYNPETLLSQDPEHGLQMRYGSGRWQLDTWVDWQSFIFEEDHHQEAFTFGLVQRLRLAGDAGGRRSLSLPAQVIVQHRGGEQDLPQLNLGVQTIGNAALGLHYRQHTDHRLLRSWEAAAMGMVAFQQAGKLWPFDGGWAAWAELRAQTRFGLNLGLGLWHGRDFVSLYGAPFFSTLSLKNKGGRFAQLTTAHWQLSYGYDLGAGCSFGAQADGFLTFQPRLQLPADFEPAGLRHAFSFGTYLRFSPNFLLWRKKG